MYTTAERIAYLENIIRTRVLDRSKIAEIQDALMGLSTTELQEWEDGLDRQDRRTFLWLVFSVEGPDTAFDIFKQTAGRRWRRAIEDELVGAFQLQVAQQDEVFKSTVARLGARAKELDAREQAVATREGQVERAEYFRREMDRLIEVVTEERREKEAYWLRLNEQAAEIMDLNAELLRLKARLYDLIERKEVGE